VAQHMFAQNSRNKNFLIANSRANIYSCQNKHIGNNNRPAETLNMSTFEWVSQITSEGEGSSLPFDAAGVASPRTATPFKLGINAIC